MTNLIRRSPSIASSRCKQIGQPNASARSVVAVAVDRLAQQRHLQAALVGQPADLGLDLGSRPALLGPANARHDAVGAELVAAEHDPHHRLMARLAVPPAMRIGS